ncbi:MAG: cobalamin biosynthesis protein [Methanobacteriota archaeon]
MTELVLILISAVLIDRIFGEPSEKIHPTVWIGKLIDALKKINSSSFFYGAFVFLLIATFSAGAVFFALKFLENFWLKVALGAAILKISFSWRALEEHALQVVQFNLENARKALSKIVGRDTSNLDEKQVISATIESVAESSADGIISPLFYYSLFGAFFGAEAGVSAAIFYRAANTLDSMIGYRKYAGFGFFSAKTDDVLNFIPARVASLLIVSSAFILRENWRNAIKIFLRDRKKTPSQNSGCPMAAMAGALEVQLEKLSYYKLGDAVQELKAEHVRRALRIVGATTVSFISLAIAFFIYD